jgi:hypothetical protein
LQSASDFNGSANQPTPPMQTPMPAPLKKSLGIDQPLKTQP